MSIYNVDGSLAFGPNERLVEANHEFMRSVFGRLFKLQFITFASALEFKWNVYACPVIGEI